MELIREFMYSVILFRLLSIIVLHISPTGTYRKLIQTFLNLLLIRLVLWFFMGLVQSV